ncbi:MAG: hypothetical protein P4N24_00395, partial [Acidobacteriota bacterium]|nr:hypothetical protein [Acidobacteriota bacterium]
MIESTRRKFLRDAGLGLGSAAMVRSSPVLAGTTSATETSAEDQSSISLHEAPGAAIDFRYSPLSWQTIYCFPDDPYKSLVGEHGDLRYWNPGRPAGAQYFPQIVEFSLLGMEPDQVGMQRLEAPGVPIVHTRIDRPDALLQITTFATRRASEGRVDNVILEIVPRTAGSLTVVPLVLVKTKREANLQTESGITVLRLDDEKSPPFLITDVALKVRQVEMAVREYRMKAEVV